jgi:hypothetical protein
LLESVDGCAGIDAETKGGKRMPRPVQAYVADRMSFILAKERVEREEVSQVVRQAYRLIERPRLTVFTHREDELLMTFVTYAHCTLHMALKNVGAISWKSEFIGAIDTLGK